LLVFFLRLGLFAFVWLLFIPLLLHTFSISLHIGRTRFAGSSTIDRFHAERDVRGGWEGKKHTQWCTHKDVTWHINIYCIIMEGPDRVLVDFFIFFLFFFVLKVSGYYIYIYATYRVRP
jgi:hypothetical protein